MKLGRVIGSIWATRKAAAFEGKRMLIVQPLGASGDSSERPLVALDTMDAGVGDVVMMATASESAIPFRPVLTPTDATIVGIAERVDRG